MKLFVYGTLKRGGINNKWLEGTYLGLARLNNHILLNDGLPMVIPGNGFVIGELWEVADFEITDQLEGHPIFYTRKEVVLESNIKAFVYIFNIEQCLKRQGRIQDLASVVEALSQSKGCQWHPV